MLVMTKIYKHHKYAYYIIDFMQQSIVKETFNLKF